MAQPKLFPFATIYKNKHQGNFELVPIPEYSWTLDEDGFEMRQAEEIELSERPKDVQYKEKRVYRFPRRTLPGEAKILFTKDVCPTCLNRMRCLLSKYKMVYRPINNKGEMWSAWSTPAYISWPYFAYLVGCRLYKTDNIGAKDKLAVSHVKNKKEMVMKTGSGIVFGILLLAGVAHAEVNKGCTAECKKLLSEQLVQGGLVADCIQTCKVADEVKRLADAVDRQTVVLKKYYEAEEKTTK